MSVRTIAAAAVLIAALAEGGSDTAPLVDASVEVPGLLLDFRYATANNFLHQKVYPDGARCLLLPDTARRLTAAARDLEARGYRLRAYDCYRPRSVQWQMWKIFPKPGYVADPRKGSNHNRGAAVDLTLALADGGVVEMPTDFDSFTPAAHHGYDGGTATSRRHREILREAMTAQGFSPNRMEWWHYDLPDAGRHPVLEVPLAAADTGTGKRP